ncbi:hypothetical protein QFC22_006700 [Naganishia vaughanmartiniae]|uniref:Uncharacterized protein n=1 Tax=Naganishia vaughanmartiniae TaxID=1424756 RepID=A0ACC2WGR1_9TREE|nr:hypothetical protein QFC22_006700 [Naganishia vaughanmartiniae]
MGSEYQDAQHSGSTSGQIDWVTLAKTLEMDSAPQPVRELSTNDLPNLSNIGMDASAGDQQMEKDHGDVERRAVNQTRALLSGLAEFTSAPLLVNMIAVGSLCVQSDDATRLGENLWKLGNKALAGNWEEMLSQRGEYDACSALSLVTSALLGQIYAVASANHELNTNAMVIEPLAFRWARAAGMYTEIPKANEPGSSLTVTTSGADLDRLWHQWAAYESQKRAVMGLYYLDGQVCSLFEVSPATRHRSNPVASISYDDAFLAPTPSRWKVIMLSKRESSHSIPFALSSLSDSSPMLETCTLPDYAVAVILEAIYSEIVESRDSPRDARQSPPLIEALRRFQSTFLRCRADAESLWMRWHMVSIELLELDLSSGRVIRSSKADLAVWFESSAGRRAILHAHAIAQLVNRMPFAAISAPRLSTPICAYHAGLVLMYAWKHDQQINRARRTLDSKPWQLETTVDWQTLGKIGYPGFIRIDSNTSTLPYQYLCGRGDALYFCRRFEASDMSSILSALATSGATWPRASAMAKRLTAMSYS